MFSIDLMISIHCCWNNRILETDIAVRCCVKFSFLDIMIIYVQSETGHHQIYRNKETRRRHVSRYLMAPIRFRR